MSGDVRTEIALISQNVQQIKEDYARVNTKVDSIVVVMQDVMLMNHRTSTLEARLARVEETQVLHDRKINRWAGGLAIIVLALIPIIRHFG